jgi:hypothetical protein
MILVLTAAGLSTACGPSRTEVATSALGERVLPANDVVLPARLRSTEGVDGRLVVTSHYLIFDAGANEASRRWQLRDIRAVRRTNENLIVVEPFEDSGYIFELPGDGLVDRDYKKVLGRLALARRLR